MSFHKYLSDFYLDLLYSNYNKDYLSCIDEDNFKNIYNLLKDNRCYFIEDVILNYLEIFEMDRDLVEKALLEVKEVLGEDWMNLIGNDMSILNLVITLANYYMEKEIGD